MAGKYFEQALLQTSPHWRLKGENHYILTLQYGVKENGVRETGVNGYCVRGTRVRNTGVKEIGVKGLVVWKDIGVGGVVWTTWVIPSVSMQPVEAK